MTPRPTIGFAAGALASTAIGALAISGAGAWAGAGFVATAVPGLVFGMWMAREHGRPGARFALALGLGFMVRIVLVGASAFLAARAGGEAGWHLLGGLAAGFVPLFVFESVWFTRSAVARERAR